MCHGGSGKFQCFGCCLDLDVGLKFGLNSQALVVFTGCTKFSDIKGKTEIECLFSSSFQCCGFAMILHAIRNILLDGNGTRAVNGMKTAIVMTVIGQLLLS